MKIKIQNVKDFIESKPSPVNFEQLSSNIASAVNQLYLSVKERKTKELVGLIKDGGVKNGTKKLL